MKVRKKNTAAAAIVSVITIVVLVAGDDAARGWPAASLQSRDRDCTSCHQAADSWTDTARVIIDIVDPQTGTSYEAADGAFDIAVRRGEELRVKSVFGVRQGHQFPPEMVGWLYASPALLKKAPESDPKFAPGWQVNRSFCMKRLVEEVKGFPGNQLAAVPMTIRPLDNAEDATISLQVLFKSSARGLAGDYFERDVRLRVID